MTRATHPTSDEYWRDESDFPIFDAHHRDSVE
jgi:hypothetical protein